MRYERYGGLTLKKTSRGMMPVVPTHTEVISGKFDGVGDQKDWKEDYIKLPSGIYVTRERTNFDLTYDQTDSRLKSEGHLFIKPIEFVEFLVNTREHEPEIYNKIISVKGLLKGERIGVRFMEKEGEMYITTRDGREKLDEYTLMKERRISLDSWLENPTKQGLPRYDVEKGDLIYIPPRDNSVANFEVESIRAFLDCDWPPSFVNGNLGVRAVRRE